MRHVPLIATVAGFCVFAIVATDASAMYNPSMGRFLSRDPIRYADGMNLYQRTNSNPPKRLDPTGTRGVLIIADESEMKNWQDLPNQVQKPISEAIDKLKLIPDAVFNEWVQQGTIAFNGKAFSPRDPTRAKQEYIALIEREKLLVVYAGTAPAALAIGAATQSSSQPSSQPVQKITLDRLIKLQTAYANALYKYDYDFAIVAKHAIPNEASMEFEFIVQLDDGKYTVDKVRDALRGDRGRDAAICPDLALKTWLTLLPAKWHYNPDNATSKPTTTPTSSTAFCFTFDPIRASVTQGTLGVQPSNR